jgi:two-component system, OmpR family, KDP operon response regulator KdpE
MPNRILVIDDEPQITRVLRAALSAQRFDVRTANDPEEGLRIFSDWLPDLVVTDLMMPEMSGVEVCRAIREGYATPVIVLSIQELLARVRAHLRRAPERISAAIEAGDFLVDPEAHTVELQGRPIHLTPTEFDLLLYLARQAGKVVTHRALLKEVWGPQSTQQNEYLRVFIGQLRKKLEAESGKQYIQTEPWVGYRFVPEGVSEKDEGDHP